MTQPIVMKLSSFSSGGLRKADQETKEVVEVAEDVALVSCVQHTWR